MGGVVSCCGGGNSVPSDFQGTYDPTLGPLEERHALERHTNEANYERRMLGSHMCNSNYTALVCGTADHRDPLLNTGPISTGILDVNGHGQVDCKDVHDACFLKYPMDHVPHHAHSPEDFINMQQRNQAILAIQDLEEKGQLEPEALEVEIRRIARDSGMSIDDVRETIVRRRHRQTREPETVFFSEAEPNVPEERRRRRRRRQQEAQREAEESTAGERGSRIFHPIEFQKLFQYPALFKKMKKAIVRGTA